MEYLEDTQDFYEYALPDVFTPDARKFSMVSKVINMLREEVTSQILNLVTQAANLFRFLLECTAPGARNYIFSLIWRCYGPKRDILDYWGTILYCLLSYYILLKDKGLEGLNN